MGFSHKWDLFRICLGMKIIVKDLSKLLSIYIYIYHGVIIPYNLVKGHNCKHLMKINTPGINIWKIKCVVFAVCICGKMNKKVTIFINIYTLRTFCH